VELNPNVPSGPLEKKWERHRFEMKLVNPANKRKYTVIVVGSGLAGAGAAASMAELGYRVKCFCYQDSPRRAHSMIFSTASGGPDTIASTLPSCRLRTQPVIPSSRAARACGSGMSG